MAKLAGVVQQLKKARARAQKDVERLEAAIRALGGATTRGPGSARRLSAAARKRIADAQRARWAKVRRAKKAA